MSAQLVGAVERLVAVHHNALVLRWAVFEHVAAVIASAAEGLAAALGADVAFFFGRLRDAKWRRLRSHEGCGHGGLVSLLRILLETKVHLLPRSCLVIHRKIEVNISERIEARVTVPKLIASLNLVGQRATGVHSPNSLVAVSSIANTYSSSCIWSRVQVVDVPKSGFGGVLGRLEGFLLVESVRGRAPGGNLIPPSSLTNATCFRRACVVLKKKACSQ
jgi:hypothetical protein